MKGLMLRKAALASLLVLVSSSTSEIECHGAFLKVDKNFSKSSSTQRRTEDEMINQAIKKFETKIQNKDGHLRRISCRFKLHDGKSLETVTKTYFNDYRKKPDYDVETHPSSGAGLQPDSVIEVIYVKHSQSLSVVHRNGRGNKRLSSKQVDLPVGFPAVMSA